MLYRTSGWSKSEIKQLTFVHISNGVMHVICNKSGAAVVFSSSGDDICSSVVLCLICSALPLGLSTTTKPSRFLLSRLRYFCDSHFALKLKHLLGQHHTRETNFSQTSELCFAFCQPRAIIFETSQNHKYGLRQIFERATTERQVQCNREQHTEKQYRHEGIAFQPPF